MTFVQALLQKGQAIFPASAKLVISDVCVDGIPVASYLLFWEVW